MGARFLDHAAAEAAIRAAREYADQLREFAGALRHYTTQAGASWQGDSYGRFCEAIDAVVRRLDQAAMDSEGAASRLAEGKARARDDEREADRLAALPV
ncbi:MAG: hypothetical protein HGA45_16900 [Chloroflexales bacterium]|nr:hypothetical protein [Chloroflexales bacterium]